MSRTLGENVRAARQRFGYRTQSRFAAALHVPQPRVADLENGRYHSMSVDTLLHIAKVLDVSVDVLLFGLDPEYDDVILKDFRGIPEAVELASSR